MLNFLLTDKVKAALIALTIAVTEAVVLWLTSALDALGNPPV